MAKRGNGEGSIYQMGDGRWRAAVSLGNLGGPTKRKTITAPTRREVQERLTELLRARQQGLPIPSEKQTVEQFLAWWLKEVATPSVRPKTLTFYEVMTRKHLVPGLGRQILSKLTPQDVQAFLNVKFTEKRKLKDGTVKGTSAKTVRHIQRTLTTALASAVKYGMVQRNVAALVDPPREGKSRAKFFTLEQARQFLAASAAHRLYALYAVVLSVGLRLGEALALSWSDLDLDASRITVNHTLQRLDGTMQLVEPKTDRSRRTVSIPAVAISALLKHRQNQIQDRQLAGTRWSGNPLGLVFTSSLGTPLDARNVLRMFQALLKAAELPNMRIHDLRHSAASILIAQGVSAKAISELLGHSAVAFTLQVYGHLMEDTRREVACRMDDALSPQPVATSVATKTAYSKPR